MTQFLLRAQPDPTWPPSRRLAYWLWQLFWVSAAGAGVGGVSLVLAVGPYGMTVARGYLERPLILLLNLILPVALALFLYALTRRAWLAFALDAAAVLGLAAGNYFKLTFRDDPLMFADLFLLKEAGNMAGKYSLFVDRKLAFALLCTASGVLFLLLLVRGRPPRRTRFRAVLGLLGGSLALLCLPVMTDEQVYETHTAYYEHLDNRWSATQQYLSRGFVYPFVHSVSSAFETAPRGYTAAAAQTMASAFADGDIPEPQKVNVVCIMLEAFQDFSRFGTPTLAHDVYAGYHALESESYTGDLVTNIFAGGTVDTERCFLTGFSQLPAFRGNTNAYPWYFRSQGYQTTGLHPSMSWFYNRENINAHMGFEDYYFMENLFRQHTADPEATMALDDLFFPLLKEDLARRQSGAPIFSFSVSYQGHGPYTADRCWWGQVEDYVPADAPYTSEERYILANYFGSVEDTIGHLTDLRDFLAAQDEPYLLVVFGDHNPWMGDGNSVYAAMGLDLDQSTQAGFSNYYSTRYLIWANDLARAALGNDFVGQGPALGPYFLMNQLFELCGWEGPAYLQSIGAVARRVPVQHATGLYLEDGLFTPTLSPEGAALSQDYSFLQYYERHHFRYGDLTS